MIMKKNMPLVSIIMSSYHPNISFFKLSVNSLLTQTYENIELLIVDDGMGDEAIDYLDECCDSRITVIRNHMNMGLAKSLNIALMTSKGEYIARMDDDDICEATRIEEQLSYFLAHKDCNILCTDASVINYDNMVVGEKITNISDDLEHLRTNLLFGTNPIIHPSVMFRSDFLKSFGLKYNDKFRKAQDYDLWLNVLQYSKIDVLHSKLLRYRVHEQQASTFGRQEQREFRNLAIQDSLIRHYATKPAIIKTHLDTIDAINDIYDISLFPWCLCLIRYGKDSWISVKIMKKYLRKVLNSLFVRSKPRHGIHFRIIRYFCLNIYISIL